MLETLLTVAPIAVCPLMMLFMMRGMHRGHGRSDTPEPSADMVTRDVRIAELEREVAALQARESPDVPLRSATYTQGEPS